MNDILPKNNLVWNSQGLILKPDKTKYWMQSHVSVPTLEHINNNIFRMYFCSRDKHNRFQIGSAEFDIKNPKHIINITKDPILKIGELGAFDDSGVTPSWVINHNKKKYLYYVGWNKGATVRFIVHVGLAISEDDGKTFYRHSRAPILERIDTEPFLTATLSIIKVNDVFRMWYISGDRWYQKNNETFPIYNVKYAESHDGIKWIRNGHICIDYKNNEEHAIARPCVIFDNGVYHMWYSHKGHDGRNYQIGYAQSFDGLKWERMDKSIFIKKSKDGFDTKMQAYAFVVKHKKEEYMFYNGNEYGLHGIGYATIK